MKKKHTWRLFVRLAFYKVKLLLCVCPVESRVLSFWSPSKKNKKKVCGQCYCHHDRKTTVHRPSKRNFGFFNCSLLDLQLPLFIFLWGEKEYAGKGSILKILVFSKFPIKIDFGFSQEKEKRKFSLLLW